MRWQAMKMLAGGAALSASQVAAALKKDFDGVSRHLRAMREAGVVASRPGDDERFAMFYIPDTFRPRPGVVDYGFCLLRLPAAGQSA